MWAWQKDCTDRDFEIRGLAVKGKSLGVQGITSLPCQRPCDGEKSWLRCNQVAGTAVGAAGAAAVTATVVIRAELTQPSEIHPRLS